MFFGYIAKKHPLRRAGRQRRPVGYWLPGIRRGAPAAPRLTHWRRSDLDALLHGVDDLLDRLVDRNPVALFTTAVAERDRSGGNVIVACQQHVGHFLLLGGPDLLLHPLRAG